MKPQELTGREARDRVAEAVRQLAAGLITSKEFLDRCWTVYTDDSVAQRATGEIEMFVDTHFIDGFWGFRLRGRHRLSPLQREMFARYYLFLKTDLPYEYGEFDALQMLSPYRPGWWTLDDIIGLFRGSFLRPKREREMDEDRAVKDRTIDDRIWPFKRKVDFEAAKQRPHLLAG